MDGIIKNTFTALPRYFKYFKLTNGGQETGVADKSREIERWITRLTSDVLPGLPDQVRGDLGFVVHKVLHPKSRLFGVRESSIRTRQLFTMMNELKRAPSYR